MPVVVTFDIAGAPPVERNRIQSFFERFGWENLGGSSYRYPRLGSDQPVEDWFNHVIPALMLFRVYAVQSQRQITKFTIDVQSSTGFKAAGLYGSPPTSGALATLYRPGNLQFGEQRLRDWLDGIRFPY